MVIIKKQETSTNHQQEIQFLKLRQKQKPHRLIPFPTTSYVQSTQCIPATPSAYRLPVP